MLIHLTEKHSGVDPLACSGIDPVKCKFHVNNTNRFDESQPVQNTTARRSMGFSSMLICLSLTACASNAKNSQIDPSDPSEHLNRKVFAFNKAIDRAVIKPVARSYTHLPKPVKNDVHNFVQNLESPGIFVNDVLQTNFRRSLATGGRFAINSTVGVLGIFDVAKHIGMPYHDADFGQTFGVWGMGAGRPIELPIFGATNTRDALGQVFGIVLLSPLGANSNTVSEIDTVKTVGGVIDGRATVLPKTDELEHSADYYVSLRDLNTKRRSRFVADGRAGLLQPAREIDSIPVSGVKVEP